MVKKIKNFINSYRAFLSAITTGIILTIITATLFSVNKAFGSLYVFFIITEIIFLNYKLING